MVNPLRPLPAPAMALLAAAVSGAGAASRWAGDTRHARPDTFEYTRIAFHYAGYTGRSWVAPTAALLRSMGWRWEPVWLRPQADARYTAIFTSRPGYPLAASLAIRLFGPHLGLPIATLAAATLAGAICYPLVRELGGSRLAGLAASVLLFALPSGRWITRLLPEGAMLAGMIAVLLGVARYWNGKRYGLPLMAAGLAWTLICKPANGMALAGAVMIGSLAAMARAPRRKAMVTFAYGGVALCGWLLASSVLGLPSLTDGMQDLATRHFRRPDKPHVISWFMHYSSLIWPHKILPILASDTWLLVLVPAVAALFWRARKFAPLLVAAGLTGMAVVALHPVSTEVTRLVIPVWVTASIGAALLVGRGEDRSPPLPESPGGHKSLRLRDPWPWRPHRPSVTPEKGHSVMRGKEVAETKDHVAEGHGVVPPGPARSAGE
jgi:hypothetical protein